jgi:predicted metallopeptidase
MSDTINLTDVFTLIIHDIIKSTDEFKSFDINKILVCCASNRKDSQGGATYGKLQPLRFKDGWEVTKFKKKFYAAPLIFINNVEILYILYLYIPKFFDMTVEDKINVLFHELYHINPKFDGDARQMGNIKHVHGHSKKSFEEKYIKYASEYYYKIKGTPFYSFLDMNFEDIKSQFKVIKYRRMKVVKPKLLPPT